MPVTRSQSRALRKFVARGVHRYAAGAVAAIGGAISSRFKTKKQVSRTITKTMSNNNNGEGLTSSTLTHASCKVVRNATIPKSVEHQCVFFSESSGGTITTGAGEGKGSIIAQEGTTSQTLTNGGTTLNLYTYPWTSSVSYRDMLSDVAVTGSGIYGANSAPPQQSTFLKTLGMEIHFANFGTGDIVLTCWILESKRDSNVTPEEYMNKLLKNASGGLAVSNTPSAGLNTGGNVGYYSEDYVVGDPTAIPGFKDEYRVLKKNRFDMAAGATHEQEYMIKMNLLRNSSALISKNADFTDSSASWTLGNTSMMFPSGTVHFYIHQRGGIALDVTGGATTPTYSATKLGVLWKKNKSMSWVKDKGKKSTPQSMYHQYPYNATSGNQKFINVVDTAANFGNV